MNAQQMTKPDDFASAAIMRLVAAGLKRQSIEIPLPALSGAHVQRASKRDVLTEVMTNHGPQAILSIADSLGEMSAEPVLVALLKAKDLTDLLLRWQRLEQFSHGRHTVTHEHLDHEVFACRHIARTGGHLPAVAETLLVMAVLTRLCEQVTRASATLKTANGQIWRMDEQWVTALDFNPGDTLVLNGNGVRAVHAAREMTQTDDLPRALRSHLSNDLLKRWTISDLSTVTGMPPRTLQRRLAKESVTFSRLVAEARLEHAAQRLCDRDGPGLSEIGFLSGYSDQPHFTRDFCKAVGITPKAYRQSFGR